MSASGLPERFFTIAGRLKTESMNKRIKKTGSMVLLFLAIVLFAPVAVSADAGGQLVAENSKIKVILEKPQEEPEPVTAVRFWLSVSVLEGEASQPVFEFSDTVLNMAKPDGVQSASISSQDGGYFIDIITSQKNDQDIFAAADQAVIGTLKLSSASASFRVQVAFTGMQPDSQKPSLRYISAASASVQTVPLTGTVPVTCSGAVSDTSSTPQTPYHPLNPDAPGYPVTPDIAEPSTQPEQPAVPDTTPGTSDDVSTDQDTQNPSQSGSQPAPKLKVAAKSKSRTVSFAWNPVSGADGYQIYRYEENTRKYTRIKTIPDPEKTSYSKTMEYGTTYAFRVRAFRKTADGGRIYGTFSPITRITTAPEKIANLSVKKKTSKKAVLRWNPAASAQGYQIYKSTKKNGTYTRIKTVKNAKTAKYTDIGKKQVANCYYKVRAYVTGTDGKRVYGSFSSIKKPRG